MIPAVNKDSYHQRIQDLDLISLVKRRLRGHLIKVFTCMNGFTILPVQLRGLFDYDLNERTRNNGAKHFVKHFDTSVAQHFHLIKVTAAWNAQPQNSELFKELLGQTCTWVKNPEMSK